MIKKQAIHANGRTKESHKFVRLMQREIESEAYISLSLRAKAIYTLLKYQFNGSNNGSIGYSVRQAAAHAGCADGTAHKALLELEEKGFIKPHKKGWFKRKIRHSTEWILTDHPMGDEKPSQEYRRWRKPD